MIRHGALAAAVALTAMRVGIVRQPEMVSHSAFEQRFDGDELRERTRGAISAGHQTAANPPAPKPCTFVRKPGKRALRRARGKARAA